MTSSHQLQVDPVAASAAASGNQDDASLTGCASERGQHTVASRQAQNAHTTSLGKWLARVHRHFAENLQQEQVQLVQDDCFAQSITSVYDFACLSYDELHCVISIRATADTNRNLLILAVRDMQYHDGSHLKSFFHDEWSLLDPTLPGVDGGANNALFFNGLGFVREMDVSC